MKDNDAVDVFADLMPNAPEVFEEFRQIATESANDCQTHHENDMRVMDYAIYCLLGVFMPALDKWGRRQQTIIWHEKEKGRAEPSFVFLGLMTNMINSSLAVRQLAACGLDRQARVVFREMTETGDLLLAIVADEEVMDQYLASPENFEDAYNHWREALRPAKVRRRVQTLTGNMLFDEARDVVRQMWKDQWDLYNWLSKSAHVDYAALSVESVAADSENVYNFNVGGRIGHRTGTTIHKLTEYLHFFLTILVLFLHSRQGWNAADPELYEAVCLVHSFSERYRLVNR